MQRSEGRWRHVRAIAFVLMGALLLGSPVRAAPAGVNPPPAVADRKAPDFERLDLQQRKVRLVDYRGKVVLLNFWATWCAPCLAEIRRFSDWQRRYGGPRGLQVLGVSMDDEAAPVRSAYRKYGLNYPVVMGDEELGESYGGVLGLPATFLIDGNGRIRFQHQGAADLDVLEREIRELLPAQ